MARSLWGTRRRRRPIAPGFADRKRAAFFNAAMRRYAWHDHERVGVRELAKYAIASVATFYDRFGSQRAFWYAVATAQFQAATRSLQRQFDPKAWADAAPQTILRRIVWHAVSSIAGETIGITRMTVRLAMSAPRAAEAYEQYRSALTDRAIKLLKPKLKVTDPEKAVRNATQAVLAIATDTAWRHHGPLLRAERQLLVTDLVSQMSGSLGIRDAGPDGPIAAHGEGENAPMMTFQGTLREPDLPIYSRNLRLFEKAANEPYRPKAKPFGHGLDPEDAVVALLRDEQPPAPRPRRPAHKRKRRFRLL